MRAMITGASSGIGKELAIRLAEQGYDLILVARRLEKLKSIQEMFKNNDIVIKQVDLSVDDEVTKLTKDLDTYDIDLFVNNAGFGKVDFSSEIEDAQELNMIDVNIVALHRLTKFAIRHMKTGKIVNISSMASYMPSPLFACYAATKYYVRAFSEAINYELKKQGRDLRVLTVYPGPVKTEFGDVAGVNQKLNGISVKKCVNAIIKGIKKNKEVIVPGLSMKIAKFFMPLVPRKLLLSLGYRIQNKK